MKGKHFVIVHHNRDYILEETKGLSDTDGTLDIELVRSRLMFWGVYRSRVIYRQLFTSLGPILMVGPVDLVPVYGVTGTLTVSLN